MGNASSTITYPNPTLYKNILQLIPNNANLIASLVSTPEGKACTFKDSIEFKFRVKQLQIISNAILGLSIGLASKLPLEKIVQNVVTYSDGTGNGGTQIPGYEWKMLSKDPFFYNEDGTNPFTQFDFVLATQEQSPSALTTLPVAVAATGGARKQKMHGGENLPIVWKANTLVSASGDRSNALVNSTQKLNEEEYYLLFRTFMIRFMNARRNLLLYMLSDCDETAAAGEILSDDDISKFSKANDDFTILFTKSAGTMSLDNKNKLRLLFKQLLILNNVIQKLSIVLNDPTITDAKFDSDLLTVVTTYTDEETGQPDTENFPFSLLANEMAYNPEGSKFNIFKEFYIFCGGTDPSIPIPSSPGISKNTEGNVGIKKKMIEVLPKFLELRTALLENRLSKLTRLPDLSSPVTQSGGKRKGKKSSRRRRR